MDFKDIKKVHFAGIGGIGVSAVAKLMLAWNKEVSGSDLVKTEITDDLERRGVKFHNSQDKENLKDDTDLLIYSPAVPDENPERLKAKELGIPEMSYPEFLGFLSQDKYTIAVSGTDGKSTTTALIGLTLEKAGLDPTVIVGSKVKSFKDGNLRVGQSKYLVVEACEHHGAMLNLKPDMIVITNIRPEHLDYYNNYDNLLKAFKDYVNKLGGNGILVLNADDNGTNSLKTDKKRLTYSLDNQSDLKVTGFKVENQGQVFKATYLGDDLGDFKLLIPGKFNVYNASAAITASLALGIEPQVVKDAISNFKNLWRRFEWLGERNGAIIISDFGHTPEAIRGTILGAKEFYPDRRLVVAFQPHHHDRTKRFFNEFVKSFDQADFLIINEIYDVKGREKAEDQDVSSKDLVNEVKKRLKDKAVIYSPSLKETKKIVEDNLDKNDLVLMIGAGDIYQTAEELVKK